MAQFDVYQLAPRGGLVVDVQSDLLARLPTRLVVPLVKAGDAATPVPRLNTTLIVADEAYVMMTQFATSIDRIDLRDRRASLADYDLQIKGAIDLLITGI